MAKPLSATKGIIVLFLVLSATAGGLFWKVQATSSVQPQVKVVATYKPFYFYIDAETPTAKPRVIKPIEPVPATTTPVPTQVKQKTYGSKPAYIPPPMPKPSYPVCNVYYPNTKVTKTYTTFSPTECSAEEARAATYTSSGYTVPDIAGQAQQQFGHINDNLQNLQITTPAPTPNPCTNLQGQTNIVGGSCK